MDQLALLEALRRPQGARLLDRIAAVPPGERDLGFAGRLRAGHDPDLVAAALTQVALRERAAGKFEAAGRLWFTREGLEQASSERMAAHHAARLEGHDTVADLCTGIGGDLMALAPGRPALAVDRDPLHLRMAQLNAETAGGAPMTVCADVTEVDLAGVQAVFTDPARRSGTRRLTPAAGSPPLSWCLHLAERVPAVAVKTAPGLPHDLVPPGWEVEFVSEGRALKEALLWSPGLAGTPRRATLLPAGHTLVPAPGAAVPCRPPGAYLLDPDPAVTRAGLVAELACALAAGGVGDVWQIDPQVAFLSADHPLQTPFGRLLAVEAALPYSLKRLRTHLRDQGVGAVTVRKRGSAVDVDDLRRRLRLSGDRRATVVLTRVDDRPWALVCADVGPAVSPGDGRP